MGSWESDSVEDNPEDSNEHKRDPLVLREGPITRAKTKKIKNALMTFMRAIALTLDEPPKLEMEEPRLINLFMVSYGEE